MKKAGIAILFLGLLLAGCKNEEPASPNVLLVIFDDLRPELGCYGNEIIKTPGLDAFAEEGLTFMNAYCQAAVCAPSRASFMTGLRPDSNMVWHLGDEFRKLLPDVVTIPQYFHSNGYYTVSIGKIFHNHMPDSVSFDEPDLRPAQYRTPEMVDRDAESFYYDEGLNEELAEVREKRLAANPNAYAGGWAYGRAVECSDAPDDAFYDGAQTDLAIETLERLKKSDQPFFMAMGYFRPHLPFVAPKKYWDLYNRDSIPPAPNPFIPVNSPIMAMNSMYELTGCYDMEYVKHPSVFHLSEDTAKLLKHGYYASVSYVDACFSRLMESLKDLGLDDNTIVVVLGDHGWKLGEHGSWCKQTNYEIDTRVPLIIRSPGKAANKKTAGLTELVDIYPTLCDLAGLKVPGYLQGESLVPLLDNPDKPFKEFVYSQFHRVPKVSPDGQRYMGYSVRSGRYRYVEWYHWNFKTKKATEYEARELYDHQDDPEENYNVSEDPAYAEVIAGLSDNIMAHYKSIALDDQ